MFGSQLKLLNSNDMVLDHEFVILYENLQSLISCVLIQYDMTQVEDNSTINGLKR